MAREFTKVDRGREPEGSWLPSNSPEDTSKAKAPGVSSKDPLQLGTSAVPDRKEGETAILNQNSVTEYNSGQPQKETAIGIKPYPGSGMKLNIGGINKF